MAYSPLGGENSLLISDRTLTQIGAAHGCSAPRSRWPGLSAAAMLSQFPKPALQHTLRRTLWRFHSRSHRKNFRHSMQLFRDHLVRTSRALPKFESYWMPEMAPFRGWKAQDVIE